MNSFPPEEPGPSSTAKSRSGPNGIHRSDASDALDCFNEDLLWIVERLVARTGGSFGFITRHVNDDQNATLLCCTANSPVADEVLLPAFVGIKSTFINPERRRRDDVPDLRHSVLPPPVSGGPDGGYRLLHLMFVPTSSVNIIATVARPNADVPFTSSEETVAAMLYPVLSRYVRIWWLHRMERRRANALSSALNLSDVGVIVLDRRAEVVFENMRAAILMERGHGLRRSEPTIQATGDRDGIRLHAAIQNAIHSNLSAAEPSEKSRLVSILPLQRTGARALISVVMHIEQRAVDPRDPAVILYLIDPEQRLEELLAPACQIYRLTTGETRLVRHLVGGLRLAEAARQMQIQPDTARAYLKQIFSKTTTNRQVDLVRLMFASMTRTNDRVRLQLI